MNEYSDPFDLAPHSRATDQTEEGREVRLVGPTPVMPPSGLTATSLPAELRGVSEGKYFYTLPCDVWETLRKKLGAGAFDEERLATEWDLSIRNGDHATRVGFFDQFPVSFQGLRPIAPPQWSDEQIRAVGMDPAKVHHAMLVQRERDEGPMNRFRLGYIGWLLTNATFLTEHDQLLSDHSNAVRQYGTSDAGSLAPQADGGLHPERLSDPAWSAFDAAAQTFLLRWRLSRLAGPYLPDPLMPLMAGNFPLSIIERLMETGGVFYLPDTVPIPSRDELRGLLNDVLHREDHPAHLAEWGKLTRADNSARNSMDGYATWFPLVHYYRILRDRHPDALRNKLGRFEAAMCESLGKGQRTIHRDLAAIRGRVGEAALGRTLEV